MDPAGYTRLKVRELYRNAWLAVEAHEIVHPNGVPGEHVLVVTPEPCGVVVEDGDELVFTVQPRFAARQTAVEIVKGGRDPGESAIECARRELREELGIVAGLWSELGSLYEIPSIVQEPVTIFLAREIRGGAASPEEHESIRSVRMTFAEALAAVADGAIDDAVTIAALLRYGLRCGLVVAPKGTNRRTPEP
jgi:ADP-ribose pyrophosphatase